MINNIHTLYYREQKRWRHKKLFFGFQCFGYHVSVEHDEKHPQPKLGGNRFMGARNSYEPGQFTLISMGLIRYSCGHISDHHEPIHIKFGVWGFFIMFYWNIVMKMLKCKKENLMTSHFSTLYSSCLINYSYAAIDNLTQVSIRFMHESFAASIMSKTWGMWDTGTIQFVLLIGDCSRIYKNRIWQSR